MDPLVELSLRELNSPESSAVVEKRGFWNSMTRLWKPRSAATAIFYCPAGVCPGTSGPDVWHVLDVPADTVLRVEKTAGAANAFIAAVTSCSGTPTVLNFVKAPTNPEIAKKPG